ncbi:MAG: Na+/H+ antiporter NhaC family protein [Eubacteriales bacterium]|nr:Na+/H+ antiporter NhaC family protein [Eubacteriales bacterium]
MEYGIICLLPPIIAIILALKTKQTLPSLFIAVWVGATIIKGWNPIAGFAAIISDYMIPSIASEYNAGLLVLVTMAGGFAYMLKITGAAESFALLVTKTINTQKKGQIITSLSAFIFCYTEPCLILGTIMRPITDKVKVSRAKLAYILDSLGCNLASFSPISSYGPFIAGLIATELAAAGMEANEWGLYIQMFPFNIYSLFAMIAVFLVAVFGFNIGSMYNEEKRSAETGEVLPEGLEPLVPEEDVVFPENYTLHLTNFIVPMAALFITIFATIFITGDIGANGVRGAFINGNITLAITMGFLIGSIAAGIVGTATKLFSVTAGFNGFIQGMTNLISVPFILIMAWSMGSVTSTMGVGAYLANVVQNYLTGGLVPAIVFLFGAAISFATGSSWGVWSIMMPIAFPMAIAFDLPLAYVIGAVISGGMFGDQCSPISDTTVLSSTGASCNHILHVSTQLPYGLTIGASAFIAYLFGGLTHLYYPSIAVMAVLVVVLLTAETKLTRAKYGDNK